MSARNLIVGMTGASGAIYAQRFLRTVAAHFDRLYLIISDQALQVVKAEQNFDLTRTVESLSEWCDVPKSLLELHDERDYFTPPASGSFLHQGMVIVPCSMGTVGRIAHGISNDLLTRAADVCLKERRKLIVVPREMPMSSIMLRNLSLLSEAGAIILPACPAWYQKPESLEELADTVVARIMQQLGLGHALMKPWMEGE